MTRITPADLSWQAQHQFTPRAIAAYAASRGVLLSAETATAVSRICTQIKEGDHRGPDPHHQT